MHLPIFITIILALMNVLSFIPTDYGYHIEYEISRVELTRLYWTATGDDGPYGTAAAYDLRVSTSYITDSIWDSCSVVPEILTMTPKPSGSAETLMVSIPVKYPNNYYFAIKVIDDAGNYSDLSNVHVYSPLKYTDTLSVDLAYCYAFVDHEVNDNYIGVDTTYSTINIKLLNNINYIQYIFGMYYTRR